jgi:hypothetical protein
MAAATWTPHAALADACGMVRSVFIRAALDCPGAFALPEPKNGVVLLGEMAARLMAGVQAAQPCIVTGWPLGRKGRMHCVTTALFDSQGACCAMARATWVAVDAVSR